MYLIISGTNRLESNTLRIAELYRRLLAERNIQSGILSLVGLNVLERNAEIEKVETDWLIPADKYIFISPEYNGSIPGVLKCLFDVSDIKKIWPGKKALLTGVSTGRAGNLRGMDDLTGILHYLGVFVHPNKLPISIVDKLFSAAPTGPDGSGIQTLDDAKTLEAIRQQLDEFLAY